jgi:hypothetical protein
MAAHPACFRLSDWCLTLPLVCCSDLDAHANVVAFDLRSFWPVQGKSNKKDTDLALGKDYLIKNNTLLSCGFLHLLLGCVYTLLRATQEDSTMQRNI